MLNEDINEIKEYNRNEEEFKVYKQKLKNSKKASKKNINNNIYIKKYNETVDDKYIEFGKIFEDKNLKYEGFLKDNKYHGIGIEYFSNGNRKRKAKYENGKILKKCYGILYNDKNEQEYIGLLLEGRPKEGKSIKYYGEKDYLIYIGDFYDYKYNGNGILYYEDGKNILFNGIFKDDNYDNGILYYIDGKKKYEGYFKNNKYDGKGTLFYKTNNSIFYLGSFKNGYFNHGILYDPSNNKIFEGEYENNIPKEGKNITLYNLDGFLKYKGDLYNFKYHGYGKLYNDNSNILLYEGEFISNLYEGKGILYENSYKKYEGEFFKGLFHGNGKQYELDNNNNLYLYYKGNFKNNEICGYGIKYYINDFIKIEGIFDSINSYEGQYYNPLGKIIYNGKIINEIPMIRDDIILYNDKGELIYNGQIYSKGFIEKQMKNFEEKNLRNVSSARKNVKGRKVKVKVCLVSKGIPGKTCFLNKLINKTHEENMLATIGVDSCNYHYNINNNKYLIKFFDTSGIERFLSISLASVRTSDIVIYLFDLSKDNDINELFINEIIENKNKNVKIYLIGNKIDITRINIEKYRKQAKILIDRGKIDKYFELSSRTGEGIEIFKKYIEIDSALILDDFEASNRNLIYIKMDKLNKYLNL